jgi:peptidoglycan/LPS O-acetylase OafA/YrhL
VLGTPAVGTGSRPQAQPGEAPVAGRRRAPLDGLRALAVAAVLLYHFGGGATSVVRGGFLGVDLFFVLSGYLITGILVREHDRSGRIDVVAFWARRIRRLFPALALVILLVVAGVWYAAPPESWPSRRSDVLWTLAYLSNWHFVSAGEDYFAVYLGASPLRHTWSLSIEEQFYACWPLLVGAVAGVAARVRRSQRRVSGALLGHRPLLWTSGALVALSALSMANDFVPGFVSRAYYGTDGRVQQLLVGAILALLLDPGGLRRRPSPRWARSTASRLGRWAPLLLGLVLAAFLLVPDDSPAYYRGGALLFAVTAACVIYVVEQFPGSAVARGLSWPPLVGLGRISYGVYLWHWPVLVFTPIPGGATALHTWQTQALRTVLTLALAIGSYRLVELPVINGRAPWVGVSKSRTMAAGLAVGIVLALTAVVGTQLPSNLREQLADRADTGCPRERVDALVSCVQHQGSRGRPVVLVVGDSTARALVPGLVEQARLNDFTVVQAAWQRCTPTGLLVVPNGMNAPDAPGRACADQARTSIRRALERYRPGMVLISDFWSHRQSVVSDGELVRAGTAEHARVLERAYASLVSDVEQAGGKTVLIELPPPGFSVGPYVAPGRPAGLATRPNDGRLLDGFNEVLRQVASRSEGTAATVSVTDLLCPGGRCDAVQNGRLVRIDGVHVTATFSRELAPALLSRADGALTRLGAGMALSR